MARDLWFTVIELFGSVLNFLHDLFEPVFGVHSWGWSIVALTVIVRVLLLPLAIKQTRSMRAMQQIQPQMRELQKKYKVDRELMRKDPEQYRAKRAKMNEELMELYRREGANPAASCLPLLAQAPVFIALFWALRDLPGLRGQPFYFFTGVADIGLDANVSQAGWPGWLLIILMSGTMFWTQKQIMARNPGAQADNPMAQQQKILLYVMPVFLAFVSFQFPLGILLYWVTTNVWQVAQQAIILRDVRREQEVARATEPEASNGPDTPPRRLSPGASSGRQKKPKGTDPTDESPATPDPTNNGSARGDSAPPSKGSRKGGASASSGKTSTGKNGATDARKKTTENGAAGTGGNGAGPDDAQGSAAESSRGHLPRRRRRGD